MKICNKLHNSLFMAEEVLRTWRSLQGILRHLTVLKYIQVIQKHRRFAMQYYDVKNNQGTPLVLGVNPHGLFVFRHMQLHRPVVTFSWAECSELSFTEKKFSIQVGKRERVGGGEGGLFLTNASHPPRHHRHLFKVVLSTYTHFSARIISLCLYLYVILYLFPPPPKLFFHSLISPVTLFFSIYFLYPSTKNYS